MGEATWRDTTILWARVSDMHDFTAVDLAQMGERQLARSRQLSEDRAAAFLAGRALIRDVVSRLGGGADIRLDSRCERCGEDHAAPRTPGFVVSVSHAEDLVAVAAARGTAALGIDVEPNHAAGRVAELGRLFAPAAAPTLAAWTRIEAAIKADGRGIAIDPSAVRMQEEPQTSDQRLWSVVLPGAVSRLQVTTLPGPVGFTLSVARG